MMGRSQVLQPSLMSSHYPVNTDMHVVSDQLGRHKGKSWSSAGGSESLHLGRCLCLSVSVLFVESGWSSEPGERKWGGGVWKSGGNFILAKDVKQSLRRTVQGLLWTLGLVLLLCLQQVHTLKPGWRLDRLFSSHSRRKSAKLWQLARSAFHSFQP